MDNNLKCPICQEIFLIPRLYQNCGHTVCEKCMKNIDKLVDEKNNCHL